MMFDITTDHRAQTKEKQQEMKNFHLPK